MNGKFAPGGRVAKVRVRITVSGVPSSAEVTITDVMLQPGGSVSGWMPHVYELPWSAGVYG